jgi:ATP-dependent DNA helicase RecG
MKDQQLIKDLIKQGEGLQLEFKEMLRKEEVAKNICAFLNAEGGIVLIGISDNGNVIGVKDADQEEVILKNYLLKTIIPEAPITVSVETIGNKKVILAKVWNGSKPPYVFDGTIYCRVGSQTIKATPDKISKLIIERQKVELHWERQPALGVFN